MQSTKSADSFLPRHAKSDNPASADQALEQLFLAEGATDAPSTPYLLPENSYDNLPPLVVSPKPPPPRRNSFWPTIYADGKLTLPGDHGDEELKRKLKDFMPVRLNYKPALPPPPKSLPEATRLPDFIAEFRNNPLEFSGEICRTCSKVINDASRRGSITAWLFKDDTCTCLNSESIDDPALNSRLAGVLRETRTNPPKERYELLEPVGYGAMGWVYKALDLHTGSIVAIKVLRAELVSSENIVRRFRQEVESTAELRHPNLVRIHGYAASKVGAPYLVMDYLAGEDLHELLRRKGHLEVAHALPIFFGIANGLSELHRHGVIHRDLKPSNVVLCENESHVEIKIVDFGFAKVLEDEADLSLTQTGEAFGSPQYMSPEQCLGQSVDERSDIYSLGCLMYEILCGVPPVLGKNVLATVAKQVKENAVSLRKRNREIPTHLDRIVLNCLNKNPVQRYQSVEELLSDLRKMHEGLPIGDITGSAEGECKMKPAPDNVDMQSIQIMFGLVLLCAVSMITALAFRNMLG